jgi:hypothetical protein
MAVNIPTQTTYFDNANDISWSALRSTFNSKTTGEIKFSTYLRNTDKNATDPIIPDATENSDIGSSNNLKVSAFRGTIKEYVIQQSGTNSDLNLAATQYWNQNLNKNVPKRIVFGGTAYASSKNNYAVKLDSEMYNVDFDHSGEIYAQGGNVGSPNGGSALYLYNRSSLRGTSSYVDLRVNSTGKIWSGGGAGSSGNSGTAGPAAYCYFSGNFNTGNPYTGGVNLGDAQPGRSCRNARSGATWSSANQNGVRSRCRGGGARRGNGEYPGGPYQCSSYWTIRCSYSYSNSVQGYAGSGGAGGPGRGYSTFNSSISGSAGNAGSPAYCPAGSGGSSSGNSGNRGNSGGEWGQASSGSAGYSIYGNRYTVTGETTTRIKGPKGYN